MCASSFPFQLCASTIVDSVECFEQTKLKQIAGIQTFSVSQLNIKEGYWFGLVGCVCVCRSPVLIPSGAQIALIMNIEAYWTNICGQVNPGWVAGNEKVLFKVQLLLLTCFTRVILTVTKYPVNCTHRPAVKCSSSAMLFEVI